MNKIAGWYKPYFINSFIGCFTLLSINSYSQTTLFSENFGTTTGIFPAGWSSSNVMNGFAAVTTSASTGYTGASGSINARLNNTGTAGLTHTLSYSNSMSTVGHNSITVLWGARGTTTFTQPVIFEWSGDGGLNWNNVNYTQVANDGTWALINGGTRIALPVGATNISNLSFRWSVTVNNAGNYQIDDFNVQGNPSVIAISSGTIAGSPFCISSTTGAALTVPFNSAGVFTANTYTAQLSDAAGSFTSQVVIGTLMSDLNTGNINASIPANTASGSGYRIRVVSNSPVITGTDNGSDMIINLAATGILSGNTGVCSGTAQTYTITPVTGASSYTWTLPASWTGTSTTNTINTTAGTSGEIKVKPVNACGNHPEQSLLINVNPSPAMPVANTATFITSTSFSANWNTVPGATGYYVDVYTPTSNVTAAAWTFPTSGTIVTPDIFSPNNNGKIISTNASTVSSIAGATTFATSATNWTAGNGVKYWQAALNTVGFTNLKFSSKQRSSPTGPRDFKLQYRVGAGLWTDIPGAAIIAADNFTSGILNNISLPAACNNQPVLGIRWVMTSDVSVGGLLDVASGGTSQVDDIYVNGDGNGFVTGLENVYTTDHSFDVFGLAPSTAYYYIIRATNGDCTSANSNEIPVTTIATCSPAITITGFNPASGPAGTRVTVMGTGFNNVTSVKFGAKNANFFSIVNNTTIIAQVAAGTPFDAINITAGGCVTTSGAKFTVLNGNGNCSINGSAGLTEIYITEVYDAISGSLSYVELFNPTAAAINLGSYALRIQARGAAGNTITDYPLTGNIAGGAVSVWGVGTGTPSCVGFTVTQPAGTGFNGNDQVFLMKSGLIIDRVDNPNYGGGSLPGFSQLRHVKAVGPLVNYNAADWAITTTEDCSHLGIPPFLRTGNNITITSEPSDVGCTGVVTLSTNANASATIGSFVWKYNDPGSMSGWLNVSTMSASPYNLNVAGSGTNTITLTGPVSIIQNLQFYVEIASSGSPSCMQASNAVEYHYETRNHYQSISGGNWSNPTAWQMSNDHITWVNACSYPAANNCSTIIINTGHNILLDIDNQVNALTVDGSLANNSANRLRVNNGVSGADFIVNGTYQDNAGTANTFTLEPGATWQLGTAATVIKTNLGGGGDYRDGYEGGIANIPATAQWIYRYTGSGISFVSSNGSQPMYYPNLTLENALAGTYSSAINTGSPQLSTFTLYGPVQPIVIKGNFNVGGSGTGNINMSNINSSAPVRVEKDLIIKIGSTLTLASANPANTGIGFDVWGNLDVAGTLTVRVGTVATGLLRFGGNAVTQTISGTGTLNLQDVTVANNLPGNVIINRNMGVPGVLSFANNSKTSIGTGDIVLQSSATATARVAPFGAGATIDYIGTARFAVERYYPADRSWRLVTAPLSATGNVFGSWQNNGVYTPGLGAFVTGLNPLQAINGLDESNLDNYSLKTFQDNAYVNIENTRTQLLSGNSASAANTGYFMFVRGDRNRSPDNTVLPNTNVTTLKSRGRLQTGTQIFTLNNSSTATSLFNLVGNPFASSVDFNLLTKNNINPNRFYIWDPHINQVGAFVTMEDYSTPGTFVSSTVTSSQGNFIQSSQAFFVQLLGPSGSLTFQESHKSGDYNGALFRPVTETGTSGRIHTQLLRLEGSRSTLADANLAEFNNAFDDGVDIDDAFKLTNVHESFGFRRNNRLLAVERRSEPKVGDTLFYNITGLTRNRYQLVLQVDNINPLTSAFLEDRMEGSSIILNMKGKTVHHFQVSSLPQSAAADRFRVVFKTIDGPLPVFFASIHAQPNAKSIALEWIVLNEFNIRHYEVEKSRDGVHFETAQIINSKGFSGNKTTYQWLDVQVASGDHYYRLRSIDASGKTTLSKIVKATISNQLPALSIYPNPVSSGRISVHFSNQPAGKYQVRLYNEMAQLIFESNFSHNGGTIIHNLHPQNVLVKGIYQIEVIHPDKTMHKLKVIR